MSSLNRVELIGNLGKDPEIHHTAAGAAIVNITVATSESWKDKQTGEKKEKTEWHRVVFFGKIADIAGEYLNKGSKVFVSGKLQTRKWTDNNGVDKYTTEVVVDGFKGEMIMLSGGSGSAPANQPAAQQQSQGFRDTPAEPKNDFTDDDIPF